ncbi:hypothetical protein DS742_23730 [Lacrimispora amygdalina]|uniref:Uncharacterized protein n=1 Tax=Lacrimispora amygdalina TaxID=253257 RepID=A0A3E2N5Y2_9FIRM|nr:hypothetical protein [Clostridium indicum]RFZ76407.1 hypothetical protein DS742_23730 [Clostridium indicum]
MQISNVSVYGLENAIRVSKFPKAVNTEDCTKEVTKTTAKLGSCKSGTGHDNFLKGIVVQFDMRFTNKMSVELERYHFIDFISSQSTMHRITKFRLEDQCNEYVDQRIIDIVQEMIDVYNGLEDMATEFAKDLYLRILYNIPSGFELTAGFTTNYQQLKTIYIQRKTHRLPEWREFCKWVETLPMFGELVLGGA